MYLRLSDSQIHAKIICHKTVLSGHRKTKMDKKNDFFLGAPLPLWGCVSIWLGNLVRLIPESAVPYAWAALFFSYGIVALYYIQMAISSKSCSNSSKAKSAGIMLGISTLFLVGSVILAVQ